MAQHNDNQYSNKKVTLSLTMKNGTITLQEKVPLHMMPPHPA
jgi:hypothetical protein